MTTKNDEKDLFEPLASIAGSGTEPPRKPPLGDVTQDDAKKKPEPRNDKPQAYYLYRDDELLDAYESAADSFKGLANERFKDGSLRIMAPDKEGTLLELAKKDKTSIEIVNLMKASREIAVYSLSDDFRHDLNAEGFKTDRAREGIIEQAEWAGVERDQAKVAPAVHQVDAEAVSKAPTFAETMKGLDDANKSLNAVRDSMPKEEWARRISAAMKDMAPPGATQPDQKPSDFKVWLQQNGREQQSSPEDGPAKKLDVGPQQSGEPAMKQDYGLS